MINSLSAAVGPWHNYYLQQQQHLQQPEHFKMAQLVASQTVFSLDQALAKTDHELKHIIKSQKL